MMKWYILSQHLSSFKIKFENHKDIINVERLLCPFCWNCMHIANSLKCLGLIYWTCLKLLWTNRQTRHYSEVPNRRKCSLRFLRFSFHPARNFSCNKQKIPPCSFISLLSKKAGRVEFFCSPARLFQSDLLLGTSE